MNTFETNKTYFFTFACNTDSVSTCKVIKRTAKTITFKNLGETKTARIFIFDGCESVKPCGSYSMAPIMKASNVYA